MKNIKKYQNTKKHQKTQKTQKKHQKNTIYRQIIKNKSP